MGAGLDCNVEADEQVPCAPDDETLLSGGEGYTMGLVRSSRPQERVRFRARENELRVGLKPKYGSIVGTPCVGKSDPGLGWWMQQSGGLALQDRRCYLRGSLEGR